MKTPTVSGWRLKSRLRGLRSATLSIAVGLLVCTMGDQFSTRVRAASVYLYVAPDGRATNSGSETSPLDLATALSATSPARPGDTIWLRDGIYRGVFTSYLTGTQEAPITVRQYPGERATIDSAPLAQDALTLFGAWTRYWGFEIMSSDPRRVSAFSGTPSDIFRGAGVRAIGKNLTLINLIIHDMGTQGVGIWDAADNTEAYGNVIYANGWLGADRGHGHGVYTQSRLGIRRLTDNLIFNQFSHGIHAYGSSTAFLNNIQAEGNILFNNGIFNAAHYERNILIGGESVAASPVAIRNYTYFTPDRPVGKPNTFGYVAGCTNLAMRENYIAQLTMTTYALVGCDGDIRNNTVLGFVDSTYPTRYPLNEYRTVRPTGTKAFVRPNRYEPGRAHVAVYNWDNLAAVSVDLAPAQLAVGMPFEIRDAEDYFGPAVFAGTYLGTAVSIPMDARGTSVPVGNVATPPHTPREFGAYVVVPLEFDTPAPTPVASIAASPASIEAGQAAQLTWTTSNSATASIDNGIGSVALTGSITVAPTQTTTYVITATGTNGLIGRDEVVVTVTQPNVRPQVTLGVSSGPYSAPASIVLSASASDSDGSIAKVQFYRGATLIGEDTSSPYAFQWTNVAAGSYQLTARAYDNRGADTSSAVVPLVVDGANVLPTVSLSVSPGPYVAPGAIDLNAVAADADGTVAKVEFYQGAQLLGVDTAAPYLLQWRNVVAGSYQLTARAYDNRSGQRTSTIVAVVVNALPTVTVTPAAGPHVAPATVDLAATATDTDGTIYRVAFYQGATKLGEDTTSPFTYRWLNVKAGTYQITARAYDNRGAEAVSAASSLVVALNAPPRVTATVSAGPFTAPAMIDLGATATDSDGTIAKVAFFQGAVRLNEDTVAPYAFRWSNVAAGTYQITARAYDNKGAEGISAVTTVTVAPTNVLPTVSLSVTGGPFVVPATINMAATASDSDGIARVEFYQGAIRLGEDIVAPYAFQWAGAPAGTHQLTAVAFDKRGGQKSAIATVTVAPRANLSVALTTLPGTFAVGVPFTYQIRVANAGPSPGTAVRVTERLPSNLALASHTVSQGACFWAYGLCDLGILAPGGSAMITVTVIPRVAGSFTNTVSVASGVLDPFLTDNSASVTNMVAP